MTRDHALQLLFSAAHKRLSGLWDEVVDCWRGEGEVHKLHFPSLYDILYPEPGVVVRSQEFLARIRELYEGDLSQDPNPLSALDELVRELPEFYAAVRVLGLNGEE